MHKPEIYVACLAAHNAGRAHGKWINANQGPEDLQADIDKMLASSPVSSGANEYAIHGQRDLGKCGEHEALENISKLAELVMTHEALAIVAAKHFDTMEKACQMVTDHYIGTYKSLADFAEDYYAPNSGIPEEFEGYIDWEAYGRDKELNCYIVSIDAGFEELHVFWG